MKLTSLREARLAEPETRRLFGNLYVIDDGYRGSGDWITIRHVKIHVSCEPPTRTKDSISNRCEIISADNPSTLVKLKRGDVCWYTRDRHGWVLGDDRGHWNLSNH